MCLFLKVVAGRIYVFNNNNKNIFHSKKIFHEFVTNNIFLYIIYNKTKLKLKAFSLLLLCYSFQFVKALF